MTRVIIIGAGCIGLSIAKAISSSSLKGVETIVLEKCSRAGQMLTSRNSEVIHAGILLAFYF
jgi:L-2-hydroxyglutarate oxidase LhgO